MISNGDCDANSNHDSTVTPTPLRTAPPHPTTSRVNKGSWWAWKLLGKLPRRTGRQPVLP